MARVSQEHLDARRRQILDAARTCFVRNGFHATSMQDVLREAELSSGAVYRYFKSKDEIIAAIAASTLEAISDAVEDVLDPTVDSPPLGDALEGLLRTLERLDDEQDLAKVALQAWAEAVRSPAIAALVEETFAGVASAVERLLAAYQKRGELVDDVPAKQMALFVSALLQGFVVRRALVGDVDAGSFGRSFRSLTAAEA